MYTDMANGVVQIAVAAFLVIIGLLICYYVGKSMSEGVCGGYDQLCGCCGNEMLSVTRDVSSNDLSRIAMGLSV